jgi:hypothetical protein
MMTEVSIRFNDIDWDLEGDYTKPNDPERGYPASFHAESIKVGSAELFDYLTLSIRETLEERAAEALSGCCRWDDERI